MSIGLKGNSDGSGAVQIGGSDAISITTGLNTTFAGTVTATGTVAGSTGTLYPLTSGTAVASTSGTAIDFTGIPSWVKRITVMINGVSTNGSAGLFIQIGPVAGVETSSYAGTVLYSTTATPTATKMSSGFTVAGSATSASSVLNGMVTLSLVNAATNTWAEQGTLGGSDNNYVHISGGVKSLAGTLSQVRITGGGTNTFDAGTINILYE